MSSFTFSFHFLLAWSAVYRINLSNSISNILPGDSRKKGGSIDRSVHCVLARIMHFIRTVMKLLFAFFPPPPHPFFQESNDGCLMRPRCTRQRMCILLCAACLLCNMSNPLLRMSLEKMVEALSQRWDFVSIRPSRPTSSHTYLFVFLFIPK